MKRVPVGRHADGHRYVGPSFDQGERRCIDCFVERVRLCGNPPPDNIFDTSSDVLSSQFAVEFLRSGPEFSQFIPLPSCACKRVAAGRGLGFEAGVSSLCGIVSRYEVSTTNSAHFAVATSKISNTTGQDLPIFGSSTSHNRSHAVEVSIFETLERYSNIGFHTSRSMYQEHYPIGAAADKNYDVAKARAYAEAIEHTVATEILAQKRRPLLAYRDGLILLDELNDHWVWLALSLSPTAMFGWFGLGSDVSLEVAREKAVAESLHVKNHLDLRKTLMLPTNKETVDDFLSSFATEEGRAIEFVKWCSVSRSSVKQQRRLSFATRDVTLPDVEMLGVRIAAVYPVI
jgi:hypothetical protein